MVGYPLAILLSLLLNGACGYPWSVVTSIQQLDNNRSPSTQQSSSKNEERLSELKLQNEMKWEQKRFKESSKESIWMSLDSESDQAEGDGSSSSEHSRNVEQVGDEMSDDTPLQNSKIKAYNNITYNLKKFIKQAMLRQNYEKSHKQQKKQMRFRNRPRGLAGRRRGGSRTTGEYTLSIVNPLEVLRRRLELEMARRRMKENRKQIKANEAILRNLG